MEKSIKHLDIYELCKQSGVKMTTQRSVIADVINTSRDHPDVKKIYQRAHKINNSISLATVYRTVKLFEDAKAIAPPEPPSPIIIEMFGTVSDIQHSIEFAIAEAWPLCSAPRPGYAPGVSTKLITGI